MNYCDAQRLRLCVSCVVLGSSVFIVLNLGLMMCALERGEGPCRNHMVLEEWRGSGQKKSHRGKTILQNTSYPRNLENQCKKCHTLTDTVSEWPLLGLVAIAAFVLNLGNLPIQLEIMLKR